MHANIGRSIYTVYSSDGYCHGNLFIPSVMLCVSAREQGLHMLFSPPPLPPLASSPTPVQFNSQYWLLVVFMSSPPPPPLQYSLFLCSLPPLLPLYIHCLNFSLYLPFPPSRVLPFTLSLYNFLRPPIFCCKFSLSFLYSPPPISSICSISYPFSLFLLSFRCPPPTPDTLHFPCPPN